MLPTCLRQKKISNPHKTAFICSSLMRAGLILDYVQSMSRVAHIPHTLKYGRRRNRFGRFRLSRDMIAVAISGSCL